jgi:hypothetical protein
MLGGVYPFYVISTPRPFPLERKKKIIQRQAGKEEGRNKKEGKKKERKERKGKEERRKEEDARKED